MTSASTIADLRLRVASATGPDRELDAAIAAAFGAEARIVGKLGYRMRSAPWLEWSGRNWHDLPSYTASVDAALALVERLRPGTMRAVGMMEEGPFCRLVVPNGPSSDVPDDNRPLWLYHEGTAATEPLAILSALLASLPAEGREA